MLFNIIMNNLNEADPVKVVLLFFMMGFTGLIYMCMIVEHFKKLIDACK